MTQQSTNTSFFRQTNQVERGANVADANSVEFITGNPPALATNPKRIWIDQATEALKYTVDGANIIDISAQLADIVQVNVKSYGAKGDGVTNDLPAFQSAVNALQARGGGQLIIPNTGSSYVFNATNPTVYAPARVLITGDNIHVVGIGMPIIQMTGITKAYIDSIDDYNSSGRDVFTCFSFMRTENCSIRGIRFEGNWDGTGTFRYASPRAKAVGFVGTINCIAEDIQGYGILGNVVNATPSDNTIDGAYQPLTGITVNNCYAEKCLENGFNYLGNTFDGVFTNNTAKLCGSTGFEAATVRLTVSNNICHQNKAAGMSISGKYCTVKGNILTENGSATDDTVGAGMILSYSGAIPSGNMSVSGNYIYGNKGFAVQLFPGLSWLRFTDNHLIDNCAKNAAAYNYGINVIGSTTRISNIVISGNTISDSVGNMIYAMNLSNADIIYIKDNDITMGAAATLSIVVSGTCTEVIVENNKVNKNISVSTSSLTSYAFNNFGYSKKVVEGTAAPTTGTWNQGDEVKNRNATLAKFISHWVCITTGTPGTWRAVGVGQGSTAARPALVANDAGYQFLDTTLAAAGKLITWTGTAWVDATGTAV